MSAMGTQSSKRKWLCVAYAFPPMNRSGMHRTAAFVRGLDAMGWQATVITAQPPSEEALDTALLLRIPHGTEIVRAPWFRPIIGHFSTPDSRTGWIAPAVWKGLGAIRRRRHEIIYSTSPYASAHLIALALNRLTGIPWIADFRDPWCGNPFHRPRRSFVERFDAFLESRVTRHATSIVCNTPTLADHFIARYPQVQGKIQTILNGIDTETFTDVVPRRLAPPEHFVFAHCGQFYGPRDPGILFDAFRRFVAEYPEESKNSRLALIGPATFQGRPLSQIACDAGIPNRVILCGEKKHAEALSLVAGADALVLAGAAGRGGNLQVPQKLFEYLGFRRPIVALLGPENPGADILIRARARFVLCEPGDTNAITLGLRDGIALARSHVAPTSSGVHRFDRSLRVAEMHSLFESMTGDRSPSPCSNPNKQSGYTIPRALDEIGVPSMMPA